MGPIPTDYPLQPLQFELWYFELEILQLKQQKSSSEEILCILTLGIELFV